MNSLKNKLVLCLIICLLGSVATFAQDAKSNKEAKFAAKVKAGISKLGTGADARIEVKLLDKTKLKGYISEVNDEGFIVVDDKTGSAVKVPYPQVKGVKGNNLSQGVMIAIGLGILAAIAIIGALLAN